MKSRETIVLRTMKDGTKIRVAVYHPEQRAIKGVIQLIHGFGEHIGQYQTLIENFVDFGYICVIHDQRGFGVLAAVDKKLQGVTDSYDNWLNDISEIREMIALDFPNLPVILFGHSLGGNIALNFLLKNKKLAGLYDKAIIESPWLRLAEPPMKAVAGLARIIGKFSGKIAVQTGLKTEYVCHDQELVKLVADDPDFHTRLSMRLYTQIADAGEYDLSHASEIKLPTLVFAAEEDHIVSKEAIRQFALSANDNVEICEIKKGYHLLHMDNVREQFFNQVERFLKA